MIDSLTTWLTQHVLPVGRQMQAFLMEQELVWLILVAILLASIGTRVVARRPRWRSVGLTIGIVTLLTFMVTGIVDGQVESGADLWSVTLRGSLAGTLTMAICWLIHPLSSALPIATWLRRQVSAAGRRCQRVWQRITERWQSWCHARRWRREGPQRDREHQHAERERRKLEKSKQLCAELRLACELIHSRHYEALAEKISREKLHELLDTYLDPTLSTTVLRRRSQQIQETLTVAAGQSEATEAHTLTDVVSRRDQRQAELVV